MKGYVQIYTGDGKGKTTAAIGLAIRALGAGKRVLFLQFMKSKSYSEHLVLKNLAPNLTVETIGKPFFIAKEGSLSPEELAQWSDEVVVFPQGKPPEEYKALAEQGVKRAEAAVSSGEFDMVILDEIVVANYFELVNDQQLQSILAKRLESVEVILTGRKASKALMKQADLVTEMKEVKHYYQQGVEARKGIEN
ncbi:MAG: cob(I)yrinic acid a,c-diamide adenosyltransferase [Sporomusaceae bacterium]|nr:cob(I)yrinic acid a,c-diamide adenosyltransferase [Sporomusaceae bacterium]